MNTLKYKHFTATYDFSETDNVYYGKIENIEGLVNFEGSTIDELVENFHEAAEDYIRILT